ncbi:hypothetical protein C7S16_6738 [Burkholderia thailandensis]|uniref:Uncharacterized protein n=1 Tax=Burkholderia thailandensis TaxID=57975 RepID=A0AAW9CNP8_BURTH|nr:hypothetical protein [Burkholderia thailandensis]
MHAGAVPSRRVAPSRATPEMPPSFVTPIRDPRSGCRSVACDSGSHRRTRR